MELYKRVNNVHERLAEGIKSFNEEQKNKRVNVPPLIGYGDNEDGDITIEEAQEKMAENDLTRKREQARREMVASQQKRFHQFCNLRGHTHPDCMSPSSRSNITNCAGALRMYNTYPSWNGMKDFKERQCKNIGQDPYFQNVDPSKRPEELSPVPEPHPFAGRSGYARPMWNTEPGYQKTKSGGVWYKSRENTSNDPAFQATPEHYKLKNAFY
jgi:hypothetical protein